MKNESEFIGISCDRNQHMLAVARKMLQLSLDMNWSESKARQMFFLGFIHDLGYEFSSVQTEHEHVGGMLLKEIGYPYWREVYCHGDADSEYWSEELRLLNTADFSVSPDGKAITPEERLQDIGARYGLTSVQYIKARTLANKLNIL